MKFISLQKRTFWLLVVVAVIGLNTVRADDLDSAFSSLVDGREYLKGFGPPRNEKTRRGVVDDFLGVNGTHHRKKLIEAVDRSVAIRQSQPPEPDLPAAVPSVQAKWIAWEALESLLTGYLYAGNRDLLDGARVAYPGSDTANDARRIPPEEPATFPGTAQKQLTYARLYFFQGIKDVLDYISEDTTGQLRAGSSVYQDTVPHYVAFDYEDSEILQPFSKFDDPHFGSPDDGKKDIEPSPSVAFSYGSAMERSGVATLLYADQLWRSAYGGPEPGKGRSSAEKDAMLGHAADLLKQSIHSQFLASLPLAAQLSDGSNQSASEFQQSKINQARVTVTAAQHLRDQILALEKPTQNALISAWDTNTIIQQLKVVQNAYQAAADKMNGPGKGHVLYDVQQAESALVLEANRQIDLQNSLETQLLDITGLNPSDYANLSTESEQQRYVDDVRATFEDLLNAQDPEALILKQGGSQMAVQALKLIQAIKQAYAQKARIDAYAQKMRVETERNNDVNATITDGGKVIGAIDAAIEIADAVTYSVCTCGLNSGMAVGLKVESAAIAALKYGKAIRQGSDSVKINSSNSSAVIANFLIEQQVAIEELNAVALNSSIAGAELRRLFANASRLVENHIFYQSKTADLWYRDPSLAFNAEKSEEEYRDLLQGYRVELYKLAKMIEAAWAERFENPVRREGSPPSESLDPGRFDGFTEAESVFAVATHEDGKKFYDALQKWDTVLRTAPYRKGYDAQIRDVNSFTAQPISLRRDIFKLIDYRYDQAGNRYDSDPDLTRQSVQRFRAILLDLASRDPKNTPNNLSQLRIDFPITYNQTRVILGQQNPVPMVQRVVPFGEFEPWWNHRVREIGIKIVGRNVIAGASTVPVRLELFGNIDRVGYWPDSLYTKSRAITTYPVPLYLRDPDKRLVAEPFFGATIDAALGTTPVAQYPVSQTWPLFCDNIVLRIGNALGTLRIENIEDIELYMKMEVGSPPPIPTGFW